MPNNVFKVENIKRLHITDKVFKKQGWNMIRANLDCKEISIEDFQLEMLESAVLADERGEKDITVQQDCDAEFIAHVLNTIDVLFKPVSAAVEATEASEEKNEVTSE